MRRRGTQLWHSADSCSAAEATWKLLRELAPALRIEAVWRRPIEAAIDEQIRPAVCRVVTSGSMIDAEAADRLAARAGAPPGTALEVRCLVCRRTRRREPPADGHPAGGLRWRVTDVPLQQMCIVGDALLIFKDPAGPVVGCAGTPAISLLAMTFDSIWHSVGPDDQEPPAGPPEELREVLAQLATGATDHQARRKANLSSRTFSRKVAELMRLLGSSSRFQAGAEAAYRGWVRPG